MCLAFGSSSCIANETKSRLFTEKMGEKHRKPNFLRRFEMSWLSAWHDTNQLHETFHLFLAVDSVCVCIISVFQHHFGWGNKKDFNFHVARRNEDLWRHCNILSRANLQCLPLLIMALKHFAFFRSSRWCCFSSLLRPPSSTDGWHLIESVCEVRFPSCLALPCTSWNLSRRRKRHSFN